MNAVAKLPLLGMAVAALLAGIGLWVMALLFSPAQTLDVPLYPQPTGETCGQTTFVMAWNYAHADYALQIPDVIAISTRQGWYIPNDPTGVYTSPAHMLAIADSYAQQYGAAAPANGHLLESFQALTFLVSQLAQGHPVIVDVNTIMGDVTSSTHFVVVTGVSLSGELITYNDPFGYISPGRHQASQETTDWNTFWASWGSNGDANNDGNGWYMIVY